MAEPSPWYEIVSTLLTPGDDMLLREQFKIPRDHKIKIPTSDCWPYPPPTGYTTFFQDHLEGGLRFPIPPFLQDLTTYFQCLLSQLAPNSYRLICSASIVFQVYSIPFDCPTFHYFFFPKKGEVGVVYFAARLGYSFLSKCPTSHKGWKHRFFFVKPPQPYTWSIFWRPEPPSQPILGQYKLESYIFFNCLWDLIRFEV